MRPRIRRTAYTHNPKANLQLQRVIKQAATELEVDIHAQRTGGTHGIPEGQSFESKSGALAKANAALDAAKAYTDEAEIAAKEYADQVAADVIAELRQGGQTQDRPEEPSLYAMYFDTDLGIPVWWNGEEWVDAEGNTV